MTMITLCKMETTAQCDLSLKDCIVYESSSYNNGYIIDAKMIGSGCVSSLPVNIFNQ